MNAWKYLDAKHYQKRLNSSMVLMSCTIHLDGKKQAVEVEKDTHEPRILQKIIERLHDMKEPDMRKNLKVTLINIAELPEGFLKITHELSDKMDLLDEVFGPRSVKALHNLLPKLSEYSDPLKIEQA
jgi:ubiquinone biosynthesis protein COQ9